MNYLKLLCLCLLIASCSAPKAVYDYDKNADFNLYKTYNYYTTAENGLSEFDEKRLLRVTDSVLQSRGFVKSDSPDFLINISAATYESGNNNPAVGVGVGGTGRNVGGGVSIGLPIGSSKRNQQLLFDFIDAKNEMLFWQATVYGYYKENVSPEVREAYFMEVVQKAFEKYPPKK